MKILGDKDLVSLVGVACFTWLGLTADRVLLLFAAFTAGLSAVFAWSDYLAWRRTVRQHPGRR